MITKKSFHTLFNKNGLANNIGSYISISNITFVIILGILFYKSGYPLNEDVIKEIIKSKQEKKTKNKNDLDINRKETNDKKIKKKKED